MGRGCCVWGPVVVCGARWLCEGSGGCVRGSVVVCGARWLCEGPGGCVVERRTFGRCSKPRAAVSKLGQFIHPTLPVCFGRDTKSCWFFLSDVSARKSKISRTGYKCVACCGLHLS